MNNLYYEFHRDYNNNIYCFKGINYCNKHFHQQLELLYVLEDQIEVCINNKNKILKKNQIAISDCFDNHTYYFNNKKSMVLIIPLQYLKKYSNYMLNKQLATNYILEEEKTLQIKKILEAIYENQNENSLLLSGYINVLLGLIIKFIPLIENEKKKQYELIKNILIYIEENYANHLDLTTISKKFGYSKYYFSRIFNQYVQCNLNDYINLVRCRHIENLIINENVYITDAAYKCGFNSIRTFYRTFKTIYKVAPKDYFKSNI